MRGEREMNKMRVEREMNKMRGEKGIRRKDKISDHFWMELWDWNIRIWRTIEYECKLMREEREMNKMREERERNE